MFGVVLFGVQCYAVARVFWVDARWLFTGLLESFYDILVPRIFAHFYCYFKLQVCLIRKIRKTAKNCFY